MKGRTQILEIQVFSTDQARSGQLTSSKSAHKILEIQVSPMKGRPEQLTSSKSARKITYLSTDQVTPLSPLTYHPVSLGDC